MSVARGKRWRILARDGFTCRYCGAGAPHVVLEVDHVLSRAMGGSDHSDNLVTACFDCNQGKKAASGWPGLSIQDRLDTAELDVQALDYLHDDAAQMAAYWEYQARDLVVELDDVRQRLIEYEVLAEEHGWFDT